MHSLLNVGARQRLPVIQQTEATECGLACLAMIASYHGHRIDLNTLRRRYPVSLKGVTLRALIQVANHLHLAGRPLRFELSHLRQLRLPAIVHWDMSHFVVLKAITGSGITVHDPALGEKRYSIDEASKHLTGIALELTPSAEFSAKTETARLPLRSFWGGIQGAGHALAQVFALSIVLELLVIAAPFYMQLVIDEVVAKGDVDLLIVLALGFGLLTAITVTSTTLRSLILLILQNTLHLQLAARLFHHLIRLPLTYFEKRHIGDILSRFTSIEPIRRLLAEGLITAVIDGLMAVATLVMIFVYSPQLGFVVVAAVALYAILRLALFQELRRRSEDVIQARAQENSTFIETMRAIQSVKLFNREDEREGQWMNRYADFVNANVRMGRVTITFKTLNDAVFGVENVLTIYLAARLALDGTLTVGMIFALVSYKRNFTEKAALLIEKAIEFRVLDLHLERLGDIALTPLEPGHDRLLAYARPIDGRIELRN